ncbi:hypothetical protein HanPSC8_Chr10g0414391 [Helianthus annuus]|nr:hypothetical protein HanPSC8_Chr10g0414391 [Helianthus annuus]
MRPLNRNRVVGTNLDRHVLLKDLVSVATDLLKNLTVESLFCSVNLTSAHGASKKKQTTNGNSKKQRTTKHLHINQIQHSESITQIRHGFIQKK